MSKKPSQYDAPWWLLIVCGVIVILMIACFVVIKVYS